MDASGARERLVQAGILAEGGVLGGLRVSAVSAVERGRSAAGCGSARSSISTQTFTVRPSIRLRLLTRRRSPRCCGRDSTASSGWSQSPAVFIRMEREVDASGWTDPGQQKWALGGTDRTLDGPPVAGASSRRSPASWWTTDPYQTVTSTILTSLSKSWPRLRIPPVLSATTLCPP